MRYYLPLIAALLVPTVTQACLWDYDTLKQERARFPETLEIITGKFLRHSPEFYHWRIQDRLKKLASDPRNAHLHDDLAVAYAKTGQFDKAIATMEKMERLQPGRYETYSNLSTFHFLKGDIEKALPIIDKALAINPEAHFGREKYQRWLGEYVLKPTYLVSFAEFVEHKQSRDMTEDDAKAAVKAVLGMMRFADHTNPVLLKALGDLLKQKDYGGRPLIDAKRMAARAYLRVGYDPKSTTFAPADVAKAREVLDLQTRHGQTQAQLPIEELIVRFREELEDAEQWYADLRSKELHWIATGQNPEVEFDKLYQEPPTVGDEPSDSQSRSWASRNLWTILGVGAALSAIVLLVGGFCIVRRLVSRVEPTGS